MMLQVSVSAFIAIGSVSAIRLVHCVECQVAVNSASRAVGSTTNIAASMEVKRLGLSFHIAAIKHRWRLANLARFQLQCSDAKVAIGMACWMVIDISSAALRGDWPMRWIIALAASRLLVAKVWLVA